MAKVINLKKARKDKARREAREKGDQNAAKFGRTKEDKIRENHDLKSFRDHVDSHKTED